MTAHMPHAAILTGASRGIGPYIARALAERGFDLLLVARSEADLKRVAQSLDSPRRVAVAALDLSAPEAAQRVVAAARDRLGGVDVLVNNAALEPQVRFHTLEAAEIESLLRVNLLAPLAMARPRTA
jgi:uncharacterized protein